MISLDDARALVLAAFPPLAPRRVPLQEALGAVAAEAVSAPEPAPPFDASAMDGYALRAADTAAAGMGSPVLLSVVATQLAGPPCGVCLEPGEAVRIMTGAPLVPGADAVLALEQARLGVDGSLVVAEPVIPGRHVRPAGDDVEQGAVLIGAGEVLSPARLGLLAGAGACEARVVPVPRVGVLSNGDELLELGAPACPGRVRDANRHLLGATLRAAGFAVVDLGIVPDDEQAIAGALTAAAGECDAVVTSGGVSAGDRDLLPQVLRELSGGTSRCLRVALKPGKPLAVGSVGSSRLPVLAMPGNPVAAAVTLELIGLPALRRRGGRPAAVEVCRGRTEVAIPRRPDAKLHAELAVARPGPWRSLAVRPCRRQGSHLLSALAEANALVLVPDGAGVGAGEDVDVVLLSTAAFEPVPTELGAGANPFGTGEGADRHLADPAAAAASVAS